MTIVITPAIAAIIVGIPLGVTIVVMLVMKIYDAVVADHLRIQQRRQGWEEKHAQSVKESEQEKKAEQKKKQDEEDAKLSKMSPMWANLLLTCNKMKYWNSAFDYTLLSISKLPPPTLYDFQMFNEWMDVTLENAEMRDKSMCILKGMSDRMPDHANNQ